MPMRNLVVLIGSLYLAGAALGQVPVPADGAGPPPGMPGMPGVAGPGMGAPGMAAPGLPRPPSGNAPVDPQVGYSDGVQSLLRNGAMGPEEGPPIPQSWAISAWNPVPCLEIRAEAVFLRPTFQQSVPLATQAQLNLDTSQYSLNAVSVNNVSRYVAAPRLDLHYHVNEFFSIQGVGYVQDGPNRPMDMIGQGDSPLYLTPSFDPRQSGYLTNLPVAAGFPTAADQAFMDYTFRAASGEVNLYKHYILQQGLISDLAFGIGGRYFGFRERSDVRFEDLANGRTGTLNARTNNDMGGVQFVAHSKLQTPWSRMRIISEGKIGLMANSTQARTGVSVQETGYFVQGQKNQTFFSPLFEGNFTAEFFISRNITIFGGVQLFYVDRVDRAGAQFQQDINVFLSNKKELGSLFMWGPRVGLMLSF